MQNGIAKNSKKYYHSFAIEFFGVKLSFRLHRGVNISVDDKGLASHADIFFGDNLSDKRFYVDDFPVFFKDIVESIFEFVNRYFFIEVIDVNCVIGRCFT